MTENPTTKDAGGYMGDWSRGAPLGRRNTLHPGLVDEPLKFQLQKVRLNGDYDQGGAYWGSNSRGAYLYVAWTDEGVRYFHAANRVAAKAHVLTLYPLARFYR